jgi:polar amino acid transport system substrate-binding protein
MLEAGRIDAAFSTAELAAEAQVKLGRPPRIVQTEPAIAQMPTYLAFTRKRDYTALRDALDRELAKMREDGRYEALRKRYGATN